MWTVECVSDWRALLLGIRLELRELGEGPPERPRDIISGNNGASALQGYDLVTGRGSWTG